MENSFASFAFAVARYLDQLGPLNASLLIAAFVVVGLVLFLFLSGDPAPVHKYERRRKPMATVFQWAAIGSLFAFAWHFYQLGNAREQARLAANPPRSEFQQPPSIEPPQPRTALSRPTPEPCNPCTGPQFVQQREFVLIRQPDSHFYAQASIGGMRTNFMIDTGASFVGLPVWMANQIGVRQLTPATSSTANGYTQAWIGIVPEITVEGVTMRNVEAMFYPSLATLPLLGQSALRQFNIEQRDDRMYFHARSL